MNFGRSQCWALLVLFPLIIFWKLVFTSQYSALTGPDASWANYAWTQYATASFRSWTLPFWDPYSDAGRTFVGEVQTGVFYPPQWILALLPRNARGLLPASDIEGFLILHCMLASLLTYHVARDFKLGRLASLVSAVAFSYSGSVMVRAFAQPNFFYGVAWIPGVFLCWLRALRASSTARKLLYLNLGGICLALILVAGHHQPFLYTALALPLAGLALRGHRAYPGASTLARLALALLLIYLFTAGYGAGQLMASTEYAGLAYRWVGGGNPVEAGGTVPYDLAAGEGLLPPEGLLSFLFPFLSSVENSPYMGITPLLLAIFGLRLFGRKRGVRVAACLVVFFLAMALGSYLPLHGLVYLTIPGFEKVRIASRSLILVHFALSLLAGYGCQKLFGKGTRGESSALPLARALLIGASMVAALLALAYFYRVQVLYQKTEYGALFFSALLLLASSACILWAVKRPQQRRLAAVGLVVLLVGDFHFAASPYIHLRRQFDRVSNFEPVQYYRADPVIDFLRTQAGPFRVDLRDERYPRNLGQVIGLETINGYSASRLQRFHDVVSSDSQAGGRTQDLLNVKYIVSAESLPLKEVFRTESTTVYENEDALPRAWSVGSALLSREFEQTLALMQADTFDPRKQVILEGSALPAASTPGIGAATESAGGDAEFRRLGPNRFVVTKRAPGSAWVVVSQNWFPGWTAKVDGREVPLVRADGTLMAARVSGPAQIEFVYRPTGLWLALAAALAAAATLVAAAVAVARERKGPPVQGNLSTVEI